MDVLDHLTEEHRKVEAMLNELSSSDPGDKRDRVVNELTEALNKHMLVEEQFLYPIVARVHGQAPEDEAETEHSLAREGLAKLNDLAHEPGFGAAVDMLKAGIGHHVEEEETEIFPKLRTKAGAEIDAMDPEQLETQIEAEMATKEELYSRARKANIAGRSTMTKDQLAEAVGQSGSQ